MNLRNYLLMADAVAFEEIEAGRPHAQTTIDLSNEGEDDEKIVISVVSKCSGAPMPGGVTKKTVQKLLNDFGFKGAQVVDLDGAFLVSGLGESEGAELLFSERDGEMTIVSSVDTYSKPRSDFSLITNFEDQIRSSIVEASRAAAKDFDLLIKAVNSMLA